MIMGKVVVRLVNMRLIPMRFLLLGDLLARIACPLRTSLESRTNGSLQVVRALAQRSDGRYDGQRPFPETVKELPSVLALFLRLPFATRCRWRIIIHIGASYGKNKGIKLVT
jgi:hypothetical protein